jgi:putative Holliday junction resolvase
VSCEAEGAGRSGADGLGQGHGRVAALDLGSRRIGIAYSDSGRTVASPWGMVERSGDAARDREAVIAVLTEIGARVVVVGLPLSLSGASGPAARAALQEVELLRADLEPSGVTVETLDERFTTIEAQRSLTAAGRKGKASRAVIDSAAAMVLLQAWLDRAGRAGPA